MPLWKIYHPVGAFTAGDKHALARKVTAVYPHLPKFYVNVIFQEIPKDSFYVGDEPVDNFIRLSIEHIARTLSDDMKPVRLKQINDAIAPFVKERGFNWEFHIDETPSTCGPLKVIGHRPPTPKTKSGGPGKISRHHQRTLELSRLPSVATFQYGAEHAREAAAATIHRRGGTPKGARGRGCLEHARPSPRGARIHT
jgi:phenylpyruvate tautomerase PptA (4-oxalocrotonate tautomerase family)